ncbi:trypsin-like peptidase domain-containing protein [Aerosakkonemataceae cyanobacterium BLCC-F154]|uniref:Trypsin-like peptidase domain-containing protein n=1 Tax=Floridaenema fluviatile BLCC-F154 TaxID=3153640 RepID=A0ABV4Y8M6_9CYAN
MKHNFFNGLSAAIVGATIVINQPQSTAPQTSTEQIVSAVAKDITVIINGQNPGSGVIISQRNNTYYVLTAKHVVATQDEYEIITPDGKQHKLDYRTVKKFPGVDLAMLQFTSDRKYRIALLGNSDRIKEGATVYTSGWPHPGRAITERIYQVTQGKVSGRPLKPLEDGYALVYTNITRSGMSGGPVLDDEGHVIAIHGRAEGESIINPDTGQTIDVKSGFNLGIPINSFWEIASKHNINLTYSLVNFTLSKSIKTTHKAGIVEVAITPDGQNFVTGNSQGEIQLWNLQTGEVQKTIGTHPDAVTYVLISPDGQTLVTGDGKTIKIWHLRTGQLKTTLSGIAQEISPNGQILAGRTVEEKTKRYIHLWNLQTGEPIKFIKVIEAPFTFTPNGQIVLYNRSEVQLWDFNTEKVLNNFRIAGQEHRSTGILNCVTVSPDGKTLAAEWYGGRVRLWNLETGEFIRTLSDPPSGGDHVCFSRTFDPNGQIYFSGSRFAASRSVYMWNLQTGRRFHLPKANAPIALSPDGRTIITAEHIDGSSFHLMKIWRSPGS